MKNHALIKEGLSTIGVIIIVTVGLFLIQPYLSFFGIGLILFVIYFFRDPKREICNEDDLEILAPADGVITDIQIVEEKKFIKQSTIRISIFMSPLNVHINRSPIRGKVKFIEYKKGNFISATKLESHDVNEKNYIGIKNEYIDVLVVQIAGMMARRIVNWTKINQILKKGERIGMIKFSSGTQIYLPIDTKINVKKGDNIVSGITVLGRYSK